MKDQAKWQDLLVQAVNRPGRIMQAYSAFHNYSIGNALLALSQCLERNLAPGPLNTFLGWQALGRHVLKGQRAITLCMPVTAKKRKANPQSKIEEEYLRTIFIFRPAWFVLSQTGGETPGSAVPPGFDVETAMTRLGISRLKFDVINGNVQGFARGQGIAVNPVAELPHKTLFHEMAHVVLGHTREAPTVDSESTPRCIREVEAESVALICCEALGLEGSDCCRGYIQHWLQGQREIPAHSAQRILSSATEILGAGSVAIRS